nr:uncharacterized protein LOC123774678 [Procambarus clarkii]
MESEGRARSGANRSSSRRGPRSDWRSSNQSGGTNSSGNQYSSSDEECDVRNSGRGYRASQRTDLTGASFRLLRLPPHTRERGSNRSRATTPLSHTSEPELADPPSLHDAAHAHTNHALANHAHNNLSHYRGQYATPSTGAGVAGGGVVGGGESNPAAVMNQLGAGHGHYYQEIPQGGLHYANHLDEYDSPVLKGGRKFPPGRRIPAGGSSLSSSDNNSDTTYAESDINSSLRAKMAALDNGESIS